MNEANRKDTSAWAMRRYSHHPDSGIIVLLSKIQWTNRIREDKKKTLTTQQLSWTMDTLRVVDSSSKCLTLWTLRLITTCWLRYHIVGRRVCQSMNEDWRNTECDQMSRANLYVARRRELVMARRTADIANAVQSAKCCLLAGLVRASDDGRAWCLNAAATLSLT